MAKSFKDSLPGELIRHVTAICGRDGEEWIDGLESTVRELEEIWSMKVLEPFAAGEFNYVAPASRDGEMTVVKIGPPYETTEIFGEADWLRQRDGHGAVKLLAKDRTRRAILIEHAFPGKNLTEIFAGDEASALGPAIDILSANRIGEHHAPADAIKLNDWFDGLRRFPGTKFPADYAVKALGIYERLSEQRDRILYLHGDFHPANIVNATRAPYLAIDAKGIVGHIGYDIACFLNNFHWWQDEKPDVDERLENAVSQFADSFDIDPFELRQWAFAQMVLGAWWTFDEMPEFYDNEVAKADVWNV